jgi:hypothetical protein
MRATVEWHGIDHVDEFPPIKVIIADGADNEDVVIKVSDEGGGIPRSHMQVSQSNVPVDVRSPILIVSCLRLLRKFGATCLPQQIPISKRALLAAPTIPVWIIVWIRRSPG